MKIQPIFATTLAEDFYSAWGTLHPKGTKVSFATGLLTKRFGKFLMTTPDPVSLNLDLAEKMIEEAKRVEAEIKEAKNNLVFSKLNNTPSATPLNSIKNDPSAEVFKKYDEQKLYNYLELSISAVVHLVTAVETFVNILIPHDYAHTERVLFLFKRKIFKPEIERYFTLQRKIELLARIKQKQDIKQQVFWESFKKIKRLRDEVIHLKSFRHNSNLVKVYNPIFITLFDIDLSKIFVEIKNLINYIEPTYIKS